MVWYLTQHSTTRSNCETKHSLFLTLRLPQSRSSKHSITENSTLKGLQLLGLLFHQIFKLFGEHCNPVLFRMNYSNSADIL